MDNMLVVVFDSERQAYEGSRALKELHAEGAITLYAQTVIAKDPDGKASVKQSETQGPLGTAVGVLTGSLVGALGGPVGMAAGAALGTLGGATFDYATTIVGTDFLEEATSHIAPGKAAVVAEVGEGWTLPLDTRMEAVGGTVLRRTRIDVMDAQISRDVEAIDAGLTSLDAEYDQATGEAKATLKAKIEASRAKLQQTQERAKASIETTQREAQAKLAALREQAAGAHADRKNDLEKRAEKVEADYKERTAKLEQAGALRQQAGRLERGALTP
jgi:uncharacterized membrane protein